MSSDYNKECLHSPTCNRMNTKTINTKGLIEEYLSVQSSRIRSAIRTSNELPWEETSKVDTYSYGEIISELYSTSGERIED